MRLIILSGGAAQGLVKALAPQFKVESGCEIEGTFGAVGAMRDKLLAGAPADLLILTRRLIDELVGQGHAVPASAIDIGTVVTAVAVRTGDSAPAVGDPEALRAALVAADEIYIPDPKLATAGIHIARALETLGITEQVAPRLRTFPNGATAMRALALARSARPIGCTQATEIVATPGVTLVAPLPEPIDLATIYTAAVSMRAALPDEACALASLLTGDAASAARRQAGFDQAPPLPA